MLTFDHHVLSPSTNQTAVSSTHHRGAALAAEVLQVRLLLAILKILKSSAPTNGRVKREALSNTSPFFFVLVRALPLLITLPQSDRAREAFFFRCV